MDSWFWPSVPQHCVDTLKPRQTEHRQVRAFFYLGSKSAAVAPPPLPLPSLLPRCCSLSQCVRRGVVRRGSGKGYSNTVSLGSPCCPLTIKTCVIAGWQRPALVVIVLYFFLILSSVYTDRKRLCKQHALFQQIPFTLQFGVSAKVQKHCWFSKPN